MPSATMVAEVLHDLGYSLQGNRKTLEGRSNPDRDAQFEHINAKVQAALAAGEPVISVDTKKKELVGDFKNGGREWRPEGEPEAVRVHDFIIPEFGRVSPTASMTWPAMRAGSAWGRITTPPPSRWRAIRRWWDWLGRRATPPPGGC